MNDQAVTPKDLIFAATSRCSCGAGLAYRRAPKRPEEHAWECSAKLLGAGSTVAEIVRPGKPPHDEPKPFAFYEIKSEGQPSAGGMTTRRVPLTPLELAEIEEGRLTTMVESAHRKVAEAEAAQAKAEGDLTAARAVVAGLRAAAS